MQENEQTTDEAVEAAEVSGQETSAMASHARKYPIILAFVFACVGVALGAFAALWKLGPPNEATEFMTQIGLNAYYTGGAGIVMLILGLSVYISFRAQSKIGELKQTIETQQYEVRSSGGVEGEAILEKLGLMADGIGMAISDLKSHIDQIDAAVQTLQSKAEGAEQSTRSLASSMDNLGMRVDKMGTSKDKDSRGTQQKAPAMQDELAPLVRLLDSLGRDEHSRAARQLEAIEGVNDALAAMEGRLRSKVESIVAEAMKPHGDPEAAAKLAEMSGAMQAMPASVKDLVCEELGMAMPAKVSESVCSKLEKSMGSVVEKAAGSVIEKSMAAVVEKAVAAVVEKSVASAVEKSVARAVEKAVSDAIAKMPAPAMAPSMPSAMPGAPPPAAALPGTNPEDSEFGEGPKETKSVLRSIDKLRALRGN